MRKGIEMSEYQYYEFQILDGRLTEVGMEAMRNLSSRVDLSATRASFVYNWGDFRGNPEQVLEKYFDAMLYMANWGTRQLMFKFPREIVNVDQLNRYQFPEHIMLSTTARYVILNMHYYDEGGGDWGWLGGEGMLDGLTALRQDILRGDYRALYLVWLKVAAYRSDFEEDDTEENLLEPPLPPGLNELSNPLHSLIEFFEINIDLVSAAAEASPSTAPDPNLASHIKDLPETLRHALLVKVLQGDPTVRIQLENHLRKLLPQPEKVAEPPRRTINVLLEKVEAYERQRKEHERQQAERAHIEKLEKLAPREQVLWDEIEWLIPQQKAAAYDKVIEILKDLRDLAKYQNRTEAFSGRVAKIRATLKPTSSLLKRMNEANLR